MTPPPEMAQFQVTTSSDWATSAPSPAAIASAVWNSVPQPPKAIPQAAMLTKTTAGSLSRETKRQRGAGKDQAARQDQRAQPAIDQNSRDPYACKRRKAENEKHKVHPIAQARRNHEGGNVGVEDVVGEDEGERDHHDRANPGNREDLRRANRHALPRRQPRKVGRSERYPCDERERKCAKDPEDAAPSDRLAHKGSGGNANRHRHRHADHRNGDRPPA